MLNLVLHTKIMLSDLILTFPLMNLHRPESHILYVDDDKSAFHLHLTLRYISWLLPCPTAFCAWQVYPPDLDLLMLWRTRLWLVRITPAAALWRRGVFWNEVVQPYVWIEFSQFLHSPSLYVIYAHHLFRVLYTKNGLFILRTSKTTYGTNNVNFQK